MLIFSSSHYPCLVQFFLDLQALADSNAAHRNSLNETHTMGPKTHAVAKEKIVCVFLNLSYFLL